MIEQFAHCAHLENIDMSTMRCNLCLVSIKFAYVKETWQICSNVFS